MCFSLAVSLVRPRLEHNRRRLSNRPDTANQNGLGIDIWFVPFNQITNFLQIFFVFEVLYTLTLGIIKISICFLFLRLFPERRIRRYLWATQLFNVTVVVVYVIVDLAQCRPMSYFWDMWEYVILVDFHGFFMSSGCDVFSSAAISTSSSKFADDENRTVGNMLVAVLIFTLWPGRMLSST